jgi:hypothetical protein
MQLFILVISIFFFIIIIVTERMRYRLERAVVSDIVQVLILQPDQLWCVLIYACHSFLYSSKIMFKNINQIINHIDLFQIGSYLKKFQMPRRIISRHEINVIIATLCKGRQCSSSTNCIHESLSTTFTTCLISFKKKKVQWTNIQYIMYVWIHGEFSRISRHNFAKFVVIQTCS